MIRKERTTSNNVSYQDDDRTLKVFINKQDI